MDEAKPSPPITGRWKPGQSGNPGGRPKTKIFREALIRMLEKTSPDEFAAAIGARAMNGDVSAFKEIVDRVDGKVPTPVGGTDDLPPIKGFAWLDPTTKE